MSKRRTKSKSYKNINASSYLHIEVLPVNHDMMMVTGPNPRESYPQLVRIMSYSVHQKKPSTAERTETTKNEAIFKQFPCLLPLQLCGWFQVLDMYSFYFPAGSFFGQLEHYW